MNKLKKLGAKHGKKVTKGVKIASNAVAAQGKTAIGSASGQLQVQAKNAVHAARNVKVEKSTTANKHLQVQQVEIYEILPRQVTLYWSPLTNVSEEVVYRVRFYKRYDTKQGWTQSEDLSTNGYTITDLTPNTSYKISVQARESSKDKYGPDSATILSIKTGTVLAEEISLNRSRAETFLSAYEKFEAYPEPQVKPDTYFNKASRTVDGALYLASFTGVFGDVARVLTQAKKLSEVGAAGLFLNNELAGIISIVAAQLKDIALSIGIQPKHLLVGIYYQMWQQKKVRITNPAIEYQNHTIKGQEVKNTVISERVPHGVLTILEKDLVLARLAYRNDPATIQWVLNRLSIPNKDLELICFRGNSGQKKPAFCVFASRSSRDVYFSIRGTKEVGDLNTNHSFTVQNVLLNIGGKVQTTQLHHGFCEAANWLLCGGGDTKPKEIDRFEPFSLTKDNVNTQPGAGLYRILKEFSNKGYKININGHSLGAGVSVVFSLLLLSIDQDIMLRVTGFATPCCVNEYITEQLIHQFCKNYKLPSRLKKVTKEEQSFFGRINLLNFVYRDDVVPRFSVHCLKTFALSIKETEHIWTAYLKADTQAAKERVFKLWVPNQRAQNQNKNVVSLPESKAEVVEAVNNLRTELQKDKHKRQYIPGAICHAFHHNGQQKAAIVSGAFGSLSTIMAFENLKDDHLGESISRSLRAIKLASNAVKVPQDWQPAEFSQDGQVNTKCGVCRYPVGWNTAVAAGSETAEVKASVHCNGCGKVCCPSCCSKKEPILKYGIVKPSPVCDVCYLSLEIDTI
eukprot:snap_masked-scaffold_14-processed-gene-11.19-mRNA-1 protein AED:1.00 eAED:1.00 QI:0/-1/0/0/-1/1/1/0/796